MELTTAEQSLNKIKVLTVLREEWLKSEKAKVLIFTLKDLKAEEGIKECLEHAYMTGEIQGMRYSMGRRRTSSKNRQTR